MNPLVRSVAYFLLAGLLEIAALCLVTTSGQGQAKIQTKINVPELCSADSAAVFLSFAVRETRAARVFATTSAQRFALLQLEAAISSIRLRSSRETRKLCTASSSARTKRGSGPRAK